MLAVGGGDRRRCSPRASQMTAMPELVALLHSFVGLAAVLVGFASYARARTSALTGAEARIHEVEIFVGVFIGAVTFTGSVIAFGKLQRHHPQQAAAAAGPPLAEPRRCSSRASVLGVLFVGAERRTALLAAARR